jgi:hypothetical protein
MISSSEMGISSSSRTGFNDLSDELNKIGVSSSSRVGFNDLSGELRNQIYHIFFESVLMPTVARVDDTERPINHDSIRYASAHSFSSIISLFLVSRQISVETRSLYYADYFPRRHYSLSSRESIYSFSRVPSPWAQTLHRVQLSAHGIAQGRKIFNPVKVALLKAAHAPARLRPRRLSFSTVHGHLRVIPAICTFRAILKLDGIPTTLLVECEDDRFELNFIGPLGRLDWTMIPVMWYMDRYAQEQPEERRARLLSMGKRYPPMRQTLPRPMSRRQPQPQPYVEPANAASILVMETAVEVVRAMGVKPSDSEQWQFSFE